MHDLNELRCVTQKGRYTYKSISSDEEPMQVLYYMYFIPNKLYLITVALSGCLIADVCFRTHSQQEKIGLWNNLILSSYNPKPILMARWTQQVCILQTFCITSISAYYVGKTKCTIVTRIGEMKSWIFPRLIFPICIKLLAQEIVVKFSITS